MRFLSESKGQLTFYDEKVVLNLRLLMIGIQRK